MTAVILLMIFLISGKVQAVQKIYTFHQFKDAINKFDKGSYEDLREMEQFFPKINFNIGNDRDWYMDKLLTHYIDMGIYHYELKNYEMAGKFFSRVSHLKGSSSLDKFLKYYYYMGKMHDPDYLEIKFDKDLNKASWYYVCLLDSLYDKGDDYFYGKNSDLTLAREVDRLFYKTHKIYAENKNTFPPNVVRYLFKICAKYGEFFPHCVYLYAQHLDFEQQKKKGKRTTALIHAARWYMESKINQQQCVKRAKELMMEREKINNEVKPFLNDFFGGGGCLLK